MVLLSCVSVLLLVLKVDGYLGRGIKEESIEEFEKICDIVVENPNFENELVIGIPWRVYYTWNVVPDKLCRDMWFKKVTPLMVNHVKMRMHQYLQTPPNWDDASLFLTMSRYRHILLAQDESKIPGSFIQIPHVPTTVFTNKPDERQIPLFSMVMKLISDDRYLIMSDCSAGVTFLLGHRNDSPDWNEIKSIAQNYTKFGEGIPSCLTALKASAKCEMLAVNNFPEIDKLVGKRWKIYYAWNLNDKVMDNCMEIMFKNATPMIINRIWNDMYEYLESQPSWVAATLLMSKTPHHEMLLFADETIPGRYIGVANIVRSDNVRPYKKSVPLFKIQMRLHLDGRYLLLADCNIGVVTLSVHQTPYRGEMAIVGVADSLHLGDGHLVCGVESHVEEIFNVINYDI